MAEKTVTSTIVDSSAPVAIGISVSQSDFAKSLLSASFDQILNGHFYWQLSDVVTLVCTSIVIFNFIATRLDKAKDRKASAQ